MRLPKASQPLAPYEQTNIHVCTLILLLEYYVTLTAVMISEMFIAPLFELFATTLLLEFKKPFLFYLACTLFQVQIQPGDLTFRNVQNFPYTVLHNSGWLKSLLS